MKLLCVVPSYWPAFQYGGPIYSVHNFNKALVRKGVDVTVYTTCVGLGDKVPINQETDVDGVKVTYFSFTRFFEFMGTTGWQFSLSMTKALKRNLKVFDIVYIIAIWNYPIAASVYYCRKFEKPYIISPRGALYSYTINKKSWKKWPYYKFIVNKGLRCATAIHYTTEDEAEKCHSSLGLKNRTFVIPNGIVKSEFNCLPAKKSLKERYPVLKNKKVILFLGRVHWIKGIDILIKAYARLVKERDNVHLLIIGNDEEGYKEKIKGWIKDYGMECMDHESDDNPYKTVKDTSPGARRLDIKETMKDVHVTFIGMIGGKEKLEAFAGSDIFVLPSYSENFGMAVVEAMVCGIPVVISNKVGICKEVEKSNAGIVVETSPESFYKGIKALLDCEDLRKEVTENANSLVTGYYDIDGVGDKMFEAFQEVLNNAEK